MAAMNLVFDFGAPWLLPSAEPVRRSSDCQREGRAKGREHADRIWRLMQQQYQIQGWTDAELAERLQIQRTTIIARRHEHPQIVQVGTRKNRQTHVNNTVWGYAP